MKCICGYKHNEYDFENEKMVSDDVFEFKKLNTHVTLDKEYGRQVQVSLHACPKCGTVRMEE